MDVLDVQPDLRGGAWLPWACGATFAGPTTSSPPPPPPPSFFAMAHGNLGGGPYVSGHQRDRELLDYMKAMSPHDLQVCASVRARA